MTSESLHITERIGRPANEVYEYAVDPANLPEWAPGLRSAVENFDGQWCVEAPMGRVGFAFIERNAYGVLDHEVTLPSGEVMYNPMRVIRDGDGCEAVFTLRRLPGMSDEESATPKPSPATSPGSRGSWKEASPLSGSPTRRSTF